MQLPVTQLPLAETATDILLPRTLPRAGVPGLYVHIPFCFHKCHYCDFYSITRQTEPRMDRFVDRLLVELDLWLKGEGGPEFRLQTIFLGGGTPSLLPLGSMGRLLEGLRRRLDLSGLEEWTIEINPATLTAEYARLLRQAGVDRLSFGAQSFDPGELKMLERHHDPEDVARSLQIAREAGFERLNLDLIYAIPGQSLDSWLRSLETALGLGTSHLSCYGLTYEPNTPMAVKKRLGQFQGAEESLELQMMHQTRARLAGAGLPAYEISNYARPGEQCRHNLLYWTGGNYLGLGPSAASHVEGWRWRNRPHLREWEEAVDAGRLPAAEVETLSPRRRAGELAMLLLRLERGLNFADFAARSGYDAQNVFAGQLEQLTKVGLIHIERGAARLTERGLNVADAVAAEFLA
jgi:oxygen-independent coproporphyrinogen-3 oxidase